MSDTNWYGNLTLALCAGTLLLFMAIPVSFVILGQYSRLHEANVAYQKIADKTRELAARELASACRSDSGSLSVRCANEKLATYYSQRTTQDSLQVQKDMAYWSMLVFFATALTVLVTSVGVWLIWGTLRETKGLLLEAQNTTAQATRMNELTEQGLVDQQRAWLKIHDIQGSFGLENSDIYLSARIPIENIGRSTARDAVVRVDVVPSLHGDRNLSHSQMRSIQRSIFDDQFNIGNHADEQRNTFMIGDKFAIEVDIGIDQEDTELLPIALFVSVIYEPFPNQPLSQTGRLFGISGRIADELIRKQKPSTELALVPGNRETLVR